MLSEKTTPIANCAKKNIEVYYKKISGKAKTTKTLPAFTYFHIL